MEREKLAPQQQREKNHSTIKQPTPPPVYRPLATGNRPAVTPSGKVGPSAPAVYRPGTPLTRKSTSSTSFPSSISIAAGAPPVYRPNATHHPTQPIQQKAWPSIHRSAVVGRVPVVYRRPSPPIVQRARRTNFWSETQKAVPIASGEHRRHIIPNSLMKDAINNWNAAHGKPWNPATCQEWLDRLNNYQPNLIPGGGIANMASGGIMHQGHTIEGSISSLSDTTAISTAVTSQFPKVVAFGGTTMARQLVSSVVSAVSTFPTAEQMKEYTSDIGHSGGFDWPTPSDSTQAHALHQAWLSVYNGFVYMRDYPASVGQDGVLMLFMQFLSLPAPTTHH